MRPKVSLVKTNDRVKGTRKAIELLDINPFKGKAVVLKPNFNTADPAPASTHYDTLHTLISWLKEADARKVTLAERSGPGPSTHDNMEKKGIFRMAKELGFDILDLQAMPPEGWVKFKPKDSHWKDGFLFPKIYKEAESIVVTCCLKTHQFGGHFTLSFKCAVGMLPPGLGPSSEGAYPYMNELHSSPYQRQMIAEINTAFSPDLIVMDGVDAFTEGGPHIGKRVNAGVMLASADRIAIDAVGVAILRHLGTTPEVSKGKIYEQDQIKRAMELGLGVPDQVNIVTGDKASDDYAKAIRAILDKEW
jgi:uncharacterized protein (DUF362 family)